MPDEKAQARYEQLIDRALFELGMARDIAEAAGYHPRRTGRLVRARRELFDEKREIDQERTTATCARLE